MIEKILAMLAALMVIFIARLLIAKQDKCHKISEELRDEVEDNLEHALFEFSALTGEDPEEPTLTHLECKVEELHRRLDMAKNRKTSHLERREKQCKTSKKRSK